VQGVKLREERAPSGLPASANVHYFRLNRSEGPLSVMAWDRIKKDHKIALRWEVLPPDAFEEIRLHWKLPEGASRP
jgi:hypothetical protein